MKEEKKRRGRPKGSVNKTDNKPKEEEKKRKRGRPKGSKNKGETEVIQKEKKKRGRHTKTTPTALPVDQEEKKTPKSKLELIELMEFDLDTIKRDRIKYMIYCEMIDEIEDMEIVGSYKYKRLNEMKREVKAYIRYCICTGEFPTIKLLNRLFGHGKNVLRTIESKNEAVSELLETLEDISEDIIVNRGTVFSIFLLKSKFGYRENITVNNHNTNTKRVINYNLKKKENR